MTILFCHPERSVAESKDPFLLFESGWGIDSCVPAGGGTFLLRQESTQRMRLRGGFELLAPAIKATSPENPTRRALTIAGGRLRLGKGERIPRREAPRNDNSFLSS